MNIKKIILEALIDMTIAIIWSMCIYYLTNAGMGGLGFYVSSIIYFLIATIIKDKYKGDKNE